MKFPELARCLLPTQAKYLVLRSSSLEPINGGTIQIRVCKIGLVNFEYEYIRVYLSNISECHLFMKAPAFDSAVEATERPETGKCGLLWLVLFVKRHPW